MQKKKGLWISLCSLFVLLLIVVFSLHSCLLVRWVAFLCCEREISYESIGWEEGRLAIRSFSLSTPSFRIQSDRVRIALAPSFSSLRVQCSLEHPLVYFDSEAIPGMKEFLSFSRASHFFQCEWTISDGIIEGKGWKPFSIKMDSEGCSCGFLEQPEAYFSVDWKEREKISITCHQFPLSSLQPLFCGLGDPWREYIDVLAGELEGTAVLSIAKGAVDHLSVQGMVSDLHLESPLWRLQGGAKNFSFEIHAPIIFFQKFFEGSLDSIEETKVNLAFHGGAVASTEAKKECTSLEGFCVLESSEGFSLYTEGKDEKNHPLILEGRGQILSSMESSFNFQIAFLNEQRERESFIQAKLQKQNQHGKASLCLQSLGPAQWELFQEMVKGICPHWSFFQGTMDGDLEFLWDQQGIYELELSSLKVHELCLHGKGSLLAPFSEDSEREWNLRLPQLEGRVHWKRSIEDPFRFLSFDLSLANGLFGWHQNGVDSQVQDLFIHLNCKWGEFFSSYAKGKINGTQGEVDLTGKVSGWQAYVHLDGDLQDFLWAVSHSDPWKGLSHRKFIASFSLKGDQKQSSIVGNLQLFHSSESQENWIFSVEFPFEAWKTNELDVCRSLSSGWLRVEHVDLRHWAFLIPDPAGSLEGQMDLAVFFNPQEVRCFLRGSNFHYQHPLFHCQIPTIGTVDHFSFEEGQSIALSWQRERREGKITLPSIKANWTLPQQALSGNAQEVEGSLMVTWKESLSSYFWNFHGQVRDLFCRCSDKIEVEHTQAQIFWDSHKIFSLQKVRGRVVLGKEKTYGFSAPVVSFPLNSGGEGSFDLRLESEIRDILRLKGDVKRGETIQCVLDPVKSHFFGSPLLLKACSFENVLHLIEMEGSFSMEIPSFFEQLDFLAHFFYLPKEQLSSLQADDWKGVLECSIRKGEEWHLSLCSRELTKGGIPAPPLRVDLIGRDNQWKLEQCFFAGFSIQAMAERKEGVWTIPHWSVKSEKGFTSEGRAVYQIEKKILKGEIERAKVTLESEEGWAPVEIPFSPFLGSLEWTGGFCIDLSSPSMIFQGEMQPFLLQVQEVKVRSILTIPFQFSLGKNLSFQKIQLEISSALHTSYVDCSSLSYDFASKQWTFAKVISSLPKEFLSKSEPSFLVSHPSDHELLQPREIPISDYFTIELDGECSSDLSSFTSHLGHMKWGDFAMEFSELSCHYQPGEFQYSLKANYGNHSYQMNHEIQLGEGYSGKCVIEEENNQSECSPLEIFWRWNTKEGFFIQEVQGNFSGLEIFLHGERPKEDPKKILQLLGNVKIDFTRFRDLLPKGFLNVSTRFSLGKGYEVRGMFQLDKDHLLLTCAEGNCFGKQFEACGYRFKTLFGRFCFRENTFRLEDFQISDSAGRLLAKSGNFFHDTEEGWHFFFPLVEVFEFRPSLLLSVSGTQEEIRPLVVRALKLFRCKGRIEDPKSFTGKGFIKFINSFKREHSILDLPSDVLGRLVGVDADLLIPVQGRLDYEMKEGKIFLTQLRNTYSEGKRSKFFLLTEDFRPFVDFDGNIRIQVKMKQYVLLKITENFILSIGGSLFQPEYHLSKKRGFF